jgi:hypothetical protein
MRVNNDILFDKTTMGGTTKVTSKTISLEHIYTYAFQWVSAGSVASGSLQIQGSCDAGINGQGDGVANWANINSAITISTIGTAIVNADGVGYKWLRAEYTPASGNGTLTVTINTKGN